jgi:hypothetical protein
MSEERSGTYRGIASVLTILAVLLLYFTSVPVVRISLCYGKPDNGWDWPWWYRWYMKPYSWAWNNTPFPALRALRAYEEWWERRTVRLLYEIEREGAWKPKKFTPYSTLQGA